MGKTRLALAVAAEVVERYPDGAWLVELAGVADGEGVVAAALAAVGAMQAPGAATVEGLAAELRGRTCLILLDNCEHLLEAVAQVVVRLLEAAAGVTVLATSREPLGVPGEVIWRVPSLDAPPADETPSLRPCRNMTPLSCSPTGPGGRILRS